MNIKRPFAPAFLNKLDKFLLLNKPMAWSTRAHLVVYYSFLFMVALAAVYVAVPDDPRSYTSVHVWTGFMIVVCILGIVAWEIYVFSFNVFKRFGVAKPTTSLLEFVLYFISIAVIASSCLIPLALETAKANKRFTNNELVDDVNNINMSMCRLAYDSLAKKWKADTLIVRDTLPKQYEPYARRNYDEDIATVEADTMFNPVISSYHLIDTAELKRMIRRKDSLSRLDDSTYIVYSCPNYIFLNTYGVDNYSTINLYTSIDLYYRVMKDYVPVDKAKTTKELLSIVNKYYYEGNEPYYSSDYYDEHQYKPFSERLIEHYKLKIVERGIDNIVDRKYRWARDGGSIWRLWFYCSLGLALLVFAFRHTTARVFFLSLLAIVVISILTSLLIAFMHSKDVAFPAWLLFYFLVFAFISSTIFRDKKRNLVKGISINLFLLMLPFVPLICTGLYYEWLEYTTADGNVFYDYPERILHFRIAEVMGVAIFLVLLPIYVHKLYRKWWGLPLE